ARPRRSCGGDSRLRADDGEPLRRLPRRRGRRRHGHLARDAARPRSARVKKVLNDPRDVVPEVLEGLVAASRGSLRLVDGTTAVVRTRPVDGKVGLLIGGGRGPEPPLPRVVGEGRAPRAPPRATSAAPPPPPLPPARRA